jgi:hypothetical protein
MTAAASRGRGLKTRLSLRIRRSVYFDISDRSSRGWPSKRHSTDAVEVPRRRQEIASLAVS